MKYKVVTDNNGYVTSITNTGTEEDTIEIDFEKVDLENLDCYKISNGTIVLDEVKLEEKEAIAEYHIQNAQVSTVEQQIIPQDFIMIKDSNYNALITNITFLWIAIITLLLMNIFSFIIHRKK